eukprot:scaffold19235_cov126-Isochrysis_galbana.AAC.13
MQFAAAIHGRQRTLLLLCALETGGQWNFLRQVLRRKVLLLILRLCLVLQHYRSVGVAERGIGKNWWRCPVPPEVCDECTWKATEASGWVGGKGMAPACSPERPWP